MASRTNDGSRPPMQMAPGKSATSESASGQGMDETEYLLSNPKNARRLLESVKEINALTDALGGARTEPAE